MSPGPLHLRVWDLPTRLFHWILVLLVICSFTTVEMGGNAMRWHVGCGYSILGLIIFRILWGIWGSRSARFASFLRGPHAVLAYAKTLRVGRPSNDHIGHNPLGGWSIVAMLTSLLFQATSGLFSDDDIITQGPLAHLVANATSSLLTDLHRINPLLIALLILVHIGAIVFYWKVKQTNLVGPMVTGIKTWHGDPPTVEPTGPAWPAVFFAAIAVGIVYLLVR